MYYCFVCHEGGDVFNFLTKRLGVDWPTAVRMVAREVGHRSRGDAEPPSRSRRTTREPLWEVNGAAAEYFRRTLWDDDLGRDARDYLEERAISRELADRFGLGFAPREIGLMRTLSLHARLRRRADDRRPACSSCPRRVPSRARDSAAG